MARQNFLIPWAESGVNTNPGDTKKDLGWIAEKPPFQYANYLQNKVEQMLQHIEIYGIPVWSALTTYPLNGWCSSGGILYRSLQAANLNNLVSDTDFWWPFNAAYTGGESETFPSGRIIKTGVSATINANSTLDVVYATPFPNGISGILLTPNNINTGSDFACGAIQKVGSELTTLTIANFLAQTTVHWQVTGW